jgi:hypothetical protein
MYEKVYRKLAQRLDAIPNGFPATDSGIELRLLAQIFRARNRTILPNGQEATFVIECGHGY